MRIFRSMINFQPQSSATCVLVIDGDISVGEMLGMVLCREGYAVADEAGSGADGLRLLQKFRPSIVITALALPDTNGHELILAMRDLRPDVRILVYTGTRLTGLMTAALATKPNGFVHKSEPLVMVSQAINLVARGISFFSPYAEQLTEKNGVPIQLSLKERSVLELVARGLSSKEVAGHLKLSPKTVEYHRTQMMQKLGVTKVAHLTRHALQLGLVSLE